MAIIQVATTLHIFKYDTPVVPLQQGVVWRVNGMFKLAHVIDLKQIQNIIDKTTEETSVVTDTRVARLISHYLKKSNRWHYKNDFGTPTASVLRLAGVGMEMGCRVTRRIGSEYQIQINTRLFDATHDSLQKLDVMMARVNSIDGEVNLVTILMDKAMILLKQVDEITRACQLAKASVVNTNLLGQKKVETLLAETRSLPYQYVVEAVEFAEPSILTNGTCLLYVLALPKVVDTNDPRLWRVKKWCWNTTGW